MMPSNFQPDVSKLQSHYDVIIVGTGAGGGTLAYALADTGKQILLLDRGAPIPREKANWNPKAVYMDGLYRTEEQWLNAEGDRVQPSLYHRVGGSTKVYGGALLRLRSQDFEALQFPEGVSPAWELTYEDFKPYYTQAERLYKVHGLRGDDPTEPPATDGFPHPPMSHEPRIQHIAAQLKQQGLQPFYLPMAIDRDEANPQQSPCIRCDTCDGYPCLTNGKADAETCCVLPALRHPNVTLQVGVEVQQILTDSSGRRVHAIAAMINGKRIQITADVVVVACGAVNSAALLLRSANEHHPKGLANSSDQVGRNLMKHNVSKFYAIAQTPNKTVFQKTLAVNDFYFGDQEHHYPLGHIHLMGKHKWQMMRSDFPQWVPNAVLDYLAQHSVDWWLQSEDLPDANNRVSIKPDGQIMVNYQPNNLSVHHQLQEQFEQILRRIGFKFFYSVPMPLKIMNHQVGTCRFGSDPTTNVLDLNCQTHDVENLYVVDSSFFPAISAVNPTLTIAANALRVADHLKQQLGVQNTHQESFV